VHLFWDNWQRGGWNKELDDDFARWDPQQRHVIHPQAKFQDLGHPALPRLRRHEQEMRRARPYMPTEMLHGPVRWRAGAGLQDYWEVMRQSKVSAGGFIWAFLDEAVKRVDLDGHLDNRGNLAPDGIVGPYREKEGSYYAIKEIWSPMVIAEKEIAAGFRRDADGREIGTRLSMRSNASSSWQLRKFARPGGTDGGICRYCGGDGQAGIVDCARCPREIKNLPCRRIGSRPEALALRVADPTGRELWTWVWGAAACQ